MLIYYLAWLICVCISYFVYFYMTRYLLAQQQCSLHNLALDFTGMPQSLKILKRSGIGGKNFQALEIHWIWVMVLEILEWAKNFFLHLQNSNKDMLFVKIFLIRQCLKTKTVTLQDLVFVQSDLSLLISYHQDQLSRIIKLFWISHHICRY